MPIVDGTEQYDWLESATGHDRVSLGVQVVGFAARIRILHAMWEDPRQRDGDIPSYDDQAKSTPLPEGAHPIEADLRAIGTATGISLGPTAGPAGWNRVRWSELAERWSIEIDYDDVEPSFSFNPALKGGSWPVTIQPMAEGSLDFESYRQLIPILEQHTSSDEFWKMSTALLWYRGPECLMRHGPMSEIVRSYTDADEPGSGANFWPDDRSWIVMSNFDLRTTIVQGSLDLIDAIRKDDFLETSELPPYHKGISFPHT